MCTLLRILVLVLIPLSFTAQVFEDVSLASGIWFKPICPDYMGGGIAWIDYDNDGWEDLYIPGGIQQDRLYKNNGDGSFTDVSIEAGLLFTSDRNTLGVASADIDNDGDRDILVTTWRESAGPDYSPNYLLRNNGDGTFTDIAMEVGLEFEGFSLSAAFMDFNKDGWVDLYIGNYIEQVGFILEEGLIVGFDHECFSDLFYLNNGDGTFTESSASLNAVNNGCTLAMNATDFDRDGDSDLMLANDFGQWLPPNVMWENTYPEPGVDDVSVISGANIGIFAMGIAAGDYNEDQRTDYYVTNLGRNVLLSQEADGIFLDVTTPAGVENTGSDGLLYTSWGTCFLDYDNDSYLDLFVANGHIPSLDFIANHVYDPNKLYRNNGDGTFEDVSTTTGVFDESIARGMAWSDYDRDGDLDLAVVNINNTLQTIDEHVILFENSGTDNYWMAFKLEGTVSHPDAFGAMVDVYFDGRVLHREVTGGGDSHASHSSTKVHFGLGEAFTVDSVVVTWPLTGTEIWYDLEVDQEHTLIEGFANSIAAIGSSQVQVYPTLCTTDLWVRFYETIPNDGIIRITDMNGRKVYENRITSPLMHVNVSGLSQGTYILELCLENEVQKSRFVRVE